MAKASKLLRLAAKLIAGGGRFAACSAIWFAHVDSRSDVNDFRRADDLFREFFRQEGYVYWFEDFTKINQDRRVLALCFAAAISEAEGD